MRVFTRSAVGMLAVTLTVWGAISAAHAAEPSPGAAPKPGNTAPGAGAASSSGAAADSPEATRRELESLRAEVERLKTQVARLQTENAELTQKLAAKEADGGAGGGGGGGAAKPRIADGEIKFELGPDKSLGDYKYPAPVGWVAQSVKGSNLGMTYVSPDRGHAILLKIHPRGAAAPEMAAKYADNVVSLQKGQLTKSKTEVIEPPAVQKDARFYVRFAEKIKVPPNKVATQLHLYRVVGRDMIEVTAITTATEAETAAKVIKMAEDLTLGVRAEK